MPAKRLSATPRKPHRASPEEGCRRPARSAPRPPPPEDRRLHRSAPRDHHERGDSTTAYLDDGPFSDQHLRHGKRKIPNSVTEPATSRVPSNAALSTSGQPRKGEGPSVPGPRRMTVTSGAKTGVALARAFARAWRGLPGSRLHERASPAAARPHKTNVVVGSTNRPFPLRPRPGSRPGLCGWPPPTWRCRHPSWASPTRRSASPRAPSRRFPRPSRCLRPAPGQ